MEPTLHKSEQPPADAELHRRLVYGDETALAEAYTAYGGLVRRVAVRGTNSRAHGPGSAYEPRKRLRVLALGAVRRLGAEVRLDPGQEYGELCPLGRAQAGGPFNEPDGATFFGGDAKGCTDCPAL